VRREPRLVDRVAGAVQIVDDRREVALHVVGQQEAIVEPRAPADRRGVVRRAPEPREQRAHEELLRQAHARVRRHLERAHLHQPEPPGGAVGRIQLVDAELGAVRVAGDVHEQVAEDAVHQPRRRAVLRAVQQAHRDLELVHRVGRVSSTRGAWLVGPMNTPEKRYESDGWFSQ
jgi:hypothetical protein